jgi:hypothetical protein
MIYLIKTNNKTMELKLNSWYVWLWNYTYGTRLPDNLCPFFWKLVLAIILFIPNVILRLPVNILRIFDKDIEAESGMGAFVWLVFISITLITYMLLHWILWLFDAYSYNSGAASAGGFIIIVTILFSIYYYILESNSFIKSDDNILITYTKSVYNKHCPKINWK